MSKMSNDEVSLGNLIAQDLANQFSHPAPPQLGTLAAMVCGMWLMRNSPEAGNWIVSCVDQAAIRGGSTEESVARISSLIDQAGAQVLEARDSCRKEFPADERKED